MRSPGPDFFPNGLVQGTNGNFYGTMHQTGPGSYGGIFELSTNGTVTTLVTFNGTNGADPKSRMILASDGNFYGVTETGGTNNTGTVFQLTQSGVLTTIAQFGSSAGLLSFFGDVIAPFGELMQGSDGNLYGTTETGPNAISVVGTVFKVALSGTLTTLATFDSINGATPWAGLVQDASGYLYGTTEYGGASNLGTIFRMTTNGSLATLASFRGTNGTYPTAQLVMGANGNLYGTTFAGGTVTNIIINITNNMGINTGTNIIQQLIPGQGTVFEVATNGALTTLVTFGGANGGVFEVTTNGALTTLVTFGGANGSEPQAGLTLGGDGNFYGVTTAGGTNGFGTVFQMTPSDTLTTLFSFNGYDGSCPDVPLTLGADGNLYGTTRTSLPGGNGTAFEITTGGTFTTLAYFNNADGATPHSGLVANTNGNYYGTTEFGGTNNLGTVYQLTPAGTETVLTSFNLTNGACPVADLTPGPNGLLYGTTYDGGTSNLGTIFTIDMSGTLTALLSFDETNGAYPQSKLVLGGDGNFYGTTTRGGTNDYGTIFQMTPGGTLTTLVSLTLSNSPADLLLGADGNLYGVNYNGGFSAFGSIFELVPGGISNLVSLNSSIGNPVTDVIQGRDGSFYGTGTSGIGLAANGTIFKASFTGSASALFDFNNTIGSMPTAPLIQGADGSFYGSTLLTSIGGSPLSSGYGVLFKFSPPNTYSNLFTLASTNGWFPDAEMIQSADGSLYGTTVAGGSGGGGDVFELFQVVGIPAVFLSVSRNGGTLMLYWSAVPNRNYQVQFSNTLSPGVWNNLGGPLPATNAVMVTEDMTSPDSQRFYRVISE